MRVSDFIIQHLRDVYKVDTFFTVSGGGCIFLIDSLGKTEGIKYIATHHEQAAAIAAEGYARINNKLGVCIVTSGPGGTNALTGTLCSWLDSIPVLFISGQVNKNLTTNYTNPSLRQLGDQEFNIINTVKSMTKMAVQVNDAKDIKSILDQACVSSTSGRPGPVWIDIPLDIQSANIEPENLSSNPQKDFDPEINNETLDFIANKIVNAKKPLMIIGNGIRLSNGINELNNFLSMANIPAITAVNGNDIINEEYPYYYGRFGTHAQICANKILAECDFLLSVGSRLYVRQTGYNFKGFAKNAYKVYVDIDNNELEKSTLYPDLKLCADAKKFLTKLNLRLSQSIYPSKQWIDQCNEYNKYPKVLDRHRNKTDFTSNYFFIEKLSELLTSEDHVITSDGSANVVTMQVLKLKGKQRLITNTGCAPMGYGLPAAIGAAVNNKVICIEGDGSLHLNVHELQTVKHNKLPIKLFVINNDGYLSIKITQKTFFNGKFVASEKNSGVSFPKFEKIAAAYEIPYFSINNNSEAHEVIKEVLKIEGPCFCEVFTDPDDYHEPKVSAKLDPEGKFIPGNLEDINWISK